MPELDHLELRGNTKSEEAVEEGPEKVVSSAAAANARLSVLQSPGRVKGEVLFFFPEHIAFPRNDPSPPT